MQKQFTIDSLKIEVFMKESELKTLFPNFHIFSTPRAEARVFVDVDEFKTLAATGTSQGLSSFFRNSFSHWWWPYLQNHMDVPSEQHGIMGRRGLTRLKGSLVHKNAASLFALLLLTFHWCRNQSNSSARLVTSGVFSSLMKLLPKVCRITVRLNPREQDPRALPSYGHSPRGWRLRGHVFLCGVSSYCRQGMQRLIFWIRTGRHSIRRSGRKPTTPLRMPRMRVGSNVESELVYVHVTQEVVARGRTWATTPDATRFSGRDRQCSPIVSVDAQLWAWVVLVVLLYELLAFNVISQLLRGSSRASHNFFFRLLRSSLCATSRNLLVLEYTVFFDSDDFPEAFSAHFSEAVFCF